MAIKNNPTMLNGINPLSYIGVNPYTPPSMYSLPRAPTVRDNGGFQIGDFWMNSTNNDLWYLAKKSIGGVQDALWILLNNGADLETLTGDTGGPVGPDANRNINTLGTAGEIIVTGVPGTNTLTWSLDASVARQYTEDTGIAIPVAGNLNILGAGGIITSGSGDTVTIDTDGTIATQYIEDTGSAIPALGILNVLGGTGIDTTGAGNTITIDTVEEVALEYPTDSGTATPSGNSLNIIADNAGNNAGDTVLFTGTGNTVQLNVTDADSNTFIGKNSGNPARTVSVATENTFIGLHSGASITTAQGNTLIGVNCGDSITTASSCVAVGLVALSSLQTGGFETALGVGALGVSTSGTQNTAVGFGAMGDLLTGINNCALGAGAGVWTGSESNNICLGPNSGVIGESNTMRLGKATGSGGEQINRTFVMGVRGITTGVNDAIAVLIDSAGQVGTVSSSIRYKDNVKDMGIDSSDIYKLRPVTFTYKHDELQAKKYGLIAEEVDKSFPYLTAYDEYGQPDSVKYHELAAILLNEIQRLEKRVFALENK